MNEHSFFLNTVSRTHNFQLFTSTTHIWLNSSDWTETHFCIAASTSPNIRSWCIFISINEISNSIISLVSLRTSKATVLAEIHNLPEKRSSQFFSMSDNHDYDETIALDSVKKWRLFKAKNKSVLSLFLRYSEILLNFVWNLLI